MNEDPGPAPDSGSEDSPATSPDANVPDAATEGVRLPPPLPAHADEGLDYARAAARAASKVPGQPAARRTQNPNSDAARRRRRRGKAAASGAWPDERDPQLLGTSLDRMVANFGWDLDLRVQGVFGRWAELVGEEVAEHCTPESLESGRLRVRTTSTAWATQLTLLAPTIVKRLNTELGHGTVTVIDVNGPGNLPTWKKGLRSTKGRGPRDTYG